MPQGKSISQVGSEMLSPVDLSYAYIIGPRELNITSWLSKHVECPPVKKSTFNIPQGNLVSPVGSEMLSPVDR